MRNLIVPIDVKSQMPNHKEETKHKASCVSFNSNRFLYLEFRDTHNEF